MISFSEYFQVLKGIIKNKSLCRILQNIESKQIKIYGNTIEFGSEPNSKNNFSSLAMKSNNLKLSFSDKHIKKKGVINIDLNKKNFLKKKYYDNVLIFNVLEHLTNIDIAKKEIKKILVKKGNLIGSTPFLYRFHGAPSDYLRFTKPFMNFFFKKDFKILEIKNLGYGPFSLCYSLISDFTKKIPYLNVLIFSIAIFIDLTLSKFVKYELKDIYPIAIYFKVKKK